MAIHNTPEEKKLIQLIGQMPLSTEQKQNWANAIREYGLSEELAEEIRQKLVAIPDGEDDAAKAHRARLAIDLTRLVKQWRFSQHSRHFNKR